MAQIKRQLENRMPWHFAYGHLVSILKVFYSINKENSSTVLYSLFSNNSVDKNEIHSFFSNIVKNSGIGSINTFQLFGSFNDLQISEELRVSRLKYIFNILSDAVTNYGSSSGEDSVQLNEMIQTSDITFSSWEGLNTALFLEVLLPQEQQDTWQILDTYNSKTSLKKFYKEKVSRWGNIDLFSFSIFLYWIDSYTFYPLSNNVINVLSQTQTGKYITNSISSYLKYIQDKKKEDIQLCRNLVIYANGESIDRKHTLLKVIDNEDRTLDTTIGCKILGLSINKTGNAINDNCYKALKSCTLYKFYDCYSFEDDGIIYQKDKDFDLYSKKGSPKISISAILGKNGAGKSTIFEMIMMVVYTLSYQFEKINKQTTIVKGDIVPYQFIKQLKKIRDGINKDHPGINELNTIIPELEQYNQEQSTLPDLNYLNIDLFIKTSSVFKISIKNGIAKIYRYTRVEDKYIKPVEIVADESFLADFCYTISINYSIFGLNRQDIGDWIFPLFHKNDSYQTPIVIEPYRRDGNLDINIQAHLAKSRLLANILEPENNTSSRSLQNSFRRITEEIKDNKTVSFKDVVKISLSNRVTDYSDDISIAGKVIKQKTLDKEFKTIVEEIVTQSDGSSLLINKIPVEVRNYIHSKLYSIAIRYKEYNRFINKHSTGLRYISYFIKTLLDDSSHIAFKIRQAFNYVKYDMSSLYKVGTFNIEDIVNGIEEIKKNNKQDELRTIDLIPPSFFDIDLLLKDQEGKEIKFNTLSSGEKQLCYSINSILYHLKNIESVGSYERSSLIKYRYINILLDEVELYFHPELQRKYISNLIAGISRTNLNNIAAINISCVTHSPYMLSDIPESNILFLDVNGEIINNKPKTFGANIHDLLMDGFFMSDSIGELALSKIKKIINEYEVLSSNNNIIKLSNEEKANRFREFEFIIKNIGEEYLKGILSDQVKYIEKRYWEKESLIKHMRSQIKLLENDPSIDKNYLSNDKN